MEVLFGRFKNRQECLLFGKCHNSIYRVKIYIVDVNRVSEYQLKPKTISKEA